MSKNNYWSKIRCDTSKCTQSDLTNDIPMITLQIELWMRKENAKKRLNQSPRKRKQLNMKFMMRVWKTTRKKYWNYSTKIRTTSIRTNCLKEELFMRLHVLAMWPLYENFWTLELPNFWTKRLKRRTKCTKRRYMLPLEKDIRKLWKNFWKITHILTPMTKMALRR